MCSSDLPLTDSGRDTKLGGTIVGRRQEVCRSPVREVRGDGLMALLGTPIAHMTTGILIPYQTKLTQHRLTARRCEESAWRSGNAGSNPAGVTNALVRPESSAPKDPRPENSYRLLSGRGVKRRRLTNKA